MFVYCFAIATHVSVHAFTRTSSLNPYSCTCVLIICIKCARFIVWFLIQPSNSCAILLSCPSISSSFPHYPFHSINVVLNTDREQLQGHVQSYSICSDKPEYNVILQKRETTLFRIGPSCCQSLPRSWKWRRRVTIVIAVVRQLRYLAQPPPMAHLASPNWLIPLILDPPRPPFPEPGRELRPPCLSAKVLLFRY